MFNSKEKITSKIKQLVNQKGYIYVLCLIIFENYKTDFEKIYNENPEYLTNETLSSEELSLLLGFLIQTEIDFSTPKSFNELIKAKEKTYSLIKKLHDAFNKPIYKKLTDILKLKEKDDFNFFDNPETLQEAIFYSESGSYDFQLIDFLEKKYKYDQKWLEENKNFSLTRTQTILKKIKELLNNKASKIHSFDIQNEIKMYIEFLDKEPKFKKYKGIEKELYPYFYLFQYIELFPKTIKEHDILANNLSQEDIDYFFTNLLDLFTIQTQEFDTSLDIKSFFNNFSITAGKDINSDFKNIHDFNIIKTKPLIKIDTDKYFILDLFALYKSVYETPYYWMIKDKKYAAIAAKNRGDIGEENTYMLLKEVFGINNIFQSVKIKNGNQDTTDIDILCLLGNKALCVQVKSKKLTLSARGGDYAQIKKDFKGAIQDAYDQGIVSRNSILNKKSHFFDKDGKNISISEKIDDVYILGITTEIYPTLTNQALHLIEKTDSDPFPIFFSLLDLEVALYYLNDPYDFLYYIRQRINLINYFSADNEMIFLGFHLANKLACLTTNSQTQDMVMLTPDWGDLIDKNYNEIKNKDLNYPNKKDDISDKWQNKDFTLLCNSIKKMPFEKKTDIIFYLLDLSFNDRTCLVNQIIESRTNALKNNKTAAFSIKTKTNNGITYVVLNENNLQNLHQELFVISTSRKYQSQANKWLSLGSLKDSKEFIDDLIFNEIPHKYNKEMEAISIPVLKGSSKKSNKTGRNELCPCGSNKKYKRCCGK